MTAMPSSPARRRMVTASRSSASATRTASAAIAARLCRGLGPRLPCSGKSQIDAGAPARARWPVGVIPTNPTFQRASYVVSEKRRTMHAEIGGLAEKRGGTHTVPYRGCGNGGHDDGATGVRAPFARYWLSQFLADFGDGVRLAALPLLAAQLTRSPAAVAAITAAQSLPWLMGAGLGVIVDRTDRRRLIVAVDITRAAIVAALAGAVLLHAEGLALIYLTAFTTGVGSALRRTAAVTCVPRLVGSADLDRANGRLIAGQIVGNELAGPAAGGWLFGLTAAVPFAVNAGALGVAVLLLLTLPSVFHPAGQPARQDAAPVRATVR